ncbi:MAG TPA: ABC transporter permease [Bryobacteraceae bacterium]|nr:ABC transporter permease [Bryobacteraceae bacterium]
MRAYRVLVKSPAFSLAAIAVLAIGIGANTAVFSVVNQVLLRPLPYSDPGRIVVISRANGGFNSSIPRFMFWKEHARLVSDMNASDAGAGIALAGGDMPEQVIGQRVSAAYFTLFGAVPAAGRLFTDAEDRPGGPKVAVLSHRLWTRRFASDRSVVGQRLILGGEGFTILGVLSAGFEPYRSADVFLPLQADANSTNQAGFLGVTARLRPGISIAAANAEMATIAKEWERGNARWLRDPAGVAVRPLQDLLVGDVRPALLMLSGAVILVLLIASANVAGLLLARATSRGREIAIRAAIGAGRLQIVRELLAESLVLAACAGVCGYLLGAWGVRVLLALAPGDLPRMTDLPPEGVATVIITLFTAVLFGLIPALQVSRPDLIAALKGSAPGPQHNRTRSLLVVAQTAVALVLLVSAVLLMRSFVALHRLDPGFDPHHLLTMSVSLDNPAYATTAQVALFGDEAVRRMEGLPGVRKASISQCVPFQPAMDMLFSKPGVTSSTGRQFEGDVVWCNVSPHYFDALSLPLKAGRLFRESEPSPVVIINESMARKYWPDENPVGRRLMFGPGLAEFEETPREIIGVVGNVLENDLGGSYPQMSYIPYAQALDAMTRFTAHLHPFGFVVRSAGNPLGLTSAVTAAIHASDPRLAVAATVTMDQAMLQSTARLNFNTLLLTIFAAIAILLTFIGVYALMAFAVEQRRRELGVRIALGATRADILCLMLGKSLLLTSVGVGIGVAGALASTRLLSKMLYGVRAVDPLTFSAVAVAVVLTALLASYVPAIRATRVDPLLSLRAE